MEREIFFVPVSAIPAGIPAAPAPRASRRWDVYKEVRASLLNQGCTPGTFHLKNRGITIVARSLDATDDKEYQLRFGPGEGIVDGANTYAVIRDVLEDRTVEVPKDQYVRVEVLTRVPEGWIAEVTNALNATMHSQGGSVSHLEEALGWLQEEIRDRHYYKSIAWSEKQRGEFDVKELLCILTCFNTASYPNSGANHPIVTYDNKPVVIESFEQDVKKDGGKAYRRLRPIVRDVLMLHDVVQSEFPKFVRQVSNVPEGLVERSERKSFRFLFLGTESSERLSHGALYAVLSAFRWLVDDDPAAAAVSWRGGFENVLRLWRELAPKFVQLSVERMREAGGRIDALGKSTSHWGMLHREVALAELMAARTAAPAVPPAPAAATPAADDAVSRTA